MSKLNSLDRLIWKAIQNVHYFSHVFDNFSFKTDANRYELHWEFLDAYWTMGHELHKYPAPDLITAEKFYGVLFKAEILGFVKLNEYMVEFKHN
jgi:hypothetical protein